MFNVAVYDSFDTVPNSVRNTASYPSAGNFFLSFEWFSLIYETVIDRGEMEPRIYVASGLDNECTGILYCMSEKKSRTLRSMTCFYSTEFAPVIFASIDIAKDIVAAITGFIAFERPRWHTVDFRYLRSDRNSTRDLVAGLSYAGYSVKSFFQYENWFHKFSDHDFDAYFDKRPSKFKNTVKRKTKQLRKRCKSRIQLFSREDSDLSPAIDAFTTVYNRSWKTQEPHIDFVPELIKLGASLDVLILGILYLDEQPAAAQIWIENENRSVIYKLAYDEKFRKLSVGTILSSYMFGRAFANRSLIEIDYGLGSEQYKKDWMTGSRKIVGVESFNKRTPIGILYATTRVARQLFRAIVNFGRQK